MLYRQQQINLIITIIDSACTLSEEILTIATCVQQYKLLEFTKTYVHPMPNKHSKISSKQKTKDFHRQFLLRSIPRVTHRVRVAILLISEFRISASPETKNVSNMQIQRGEISHAA